MALVTRLKAVAGTALLLCFVGGGGWFWFLSGRTLEDADRLSSILAGFASLLFGLTGVAFGYAAMHQRHGSKRELVGPASYAVTPTAAEKPAEPPTYVGGDVHGPLVTGNKYVFMLDGLSRRMVVLFAASAAVLLVLSVVAFTKDRRRDDEVLTGAYTVVVYGSAAGGSPFERQGELRIRPADDGLPYKWCLQVGRPLGAPQPGSVWFGTHGTCFGSGYDGPISTVEEEDGETVISPLPSPPPPPKGRALESFTVSSGLTAPVYAPDRGSVRFRVNGSRLEGAIALEGLSIFGDPGRGTLTTTFTAVLASRDPDALLSTPVDPVPLVTPVPAPTAKGQRYTVKTILSFQRVRGSEAFVASARARFASATFMIEQVDEGDFVYMTADSLDNPLKGSVRGSGPIYTLAAQRTSTIGDSRSSVGGTLDTTGAEPTVRLTLTSTSDTGETSYEVAAVLSPA